MIDVIGWLGSICLSLCGAPQAWACIRQGHARGIDPGFLTLWLGGEVLVFTYVATEVKDASLLLNYTANLLFVGVIAYYRAFPRRPDEAGR